MGALGAHVSSALVGPRTAVSKRIGVDIFSAIQDSRDTVSEGTTKRVQSEKTSIGIETSIPFGNFKGNDARDPSPTKRQRNA